MSGHITIETNDWRQGLSPDLRAHLEQIRAQARGDFSANVKGRFSEDDLNSITDRALERLETELRERPITSNDELAASWHSIVSDFYQNNFWGFEKKREIPRHERPKAKKTDAQRLAGYLRTFLMPMLVTKSMVLYFGLQYSMFPGQGYGYGLIASIGLTVGSFIYFVWAASREEAQLEAQSRTETQQ